ncbi:DNA (Cytosine-5)-methyltransferase DRM1/2 isoform 2 [Hibiscus syriacus]|uniref:DNA (Cytosine-5)-methyltransferase DRM1/2 isoform 2 n=1 Tax=Hibiscus syriacus TaxID=106335 RepID=A0A6A2Y1S1_HIBSY|nr:DNA (Cytosine-5)-methyltransferase DRM1/2 isoform 2 [Hibiscus syriacus]
MTRLHIQWYKLIKNLHPCNVDSDNNSSDYEAIFQDDFTYIDSSSDIEEIMNSDSDEESKLLYLTKMGFSEAEASITMERCGSDSSITELTDFICADQMAKVTDALLMVEDRKPLCNDPNYKQRRNLGYDLWKKKKQRKLEKKLLNEDDHAVHLSIPMIGSGVPTKLDQITQRTLPEDAIEHIILPNSMISSVQPDQITQRTLPEDAIEHIILPNSMISSVQPDQITQRTLPEDAIEHIIFVPVNVWTRISQCLFDVEPEFVDSKHFHATTLKRAIFIILPIKNRFSLILLPPCAVHDAFPLTTNWHKVVPLKYDEVEVFLGFPKNHTQGGESARDMFLGGINVLSLFSEISDAEVAFYCLVLFENVFSPFFIEE